MAIGYFGDIVFTTSDKKILSFSGFKLSAGGSWGEHKRNGGKSRWEFMGPDSQSVSFTVELDANYGVKPRKELEKLIEYTERGYVAPLVIGNRNIGSGKWRLIKVSSSWGHIMSGGELVKASVSLTLGEYV
ncbi:MAG: phage tail protein [Butyrivibrio sp.]|nr:phage tail protein [Butyrivibrio sp.]